jgi:aldehyde dehydrogenase
MDADDEFFDKAIEGLVLFAFNSGEVCTCPSRALIEESIYEPFMKRVIERVKAIKLGNPLDTENTMGAQNSFNQKEKIAKYLKIAKEDGAECLVDGDIYLSSNSRFFISTKRGMSWINMITIYPNSSSLNSS